MDITAIFTRNTFSFYNPQPVQCWYICRRNDIFFFHQLDLFYFFLACRPGTTLGDNVYKIISEDLVDVAHSEVCRSFSATVTSVM